MAKHSFRTQSFSALGGGAGTGKTVAENIAAAQCGENLVVARCVDEFRKQSDWHKVLKAAKHHNETMFM